MSIKSVDLDKILLIKQKKKEAGLSERYIWERFCAETVYNFENEERKRLKQRERVKREWKTLKERKRKEKHKEMERGRKEINTKREER